MSHNQAFEERSGPALRLPIAYRFTTAPAPADHVLMREQVPLADIPAGSYIRGIEIGFAKAPPAVLTGEEQLLAFLGGAAADLGPVILSIEWSQPAGGAPDAS